MDPYFFSSFVNANHIVGLNQGYITFSLLPAAKHFINALESNRVGLNLNFEFKSAHELLMNLNLSLDSTFAKSMNLNLNLVFSKSMNLNLNLVFSKSMNLNLNLKIKKQNEWIQPVPSLREGGTGSVPP